MKRYFPILIGLCLLIAGLTVGDSYGGLAYDKLTVYENGAQTVYAPGEPVPSTRGKYVRADMTGDWETVLNVLDARCVETQQLDGVTVVYAFSPRFSAYETLSFGRVNVMIAVRGDRLAVGSPLLKGSY